MSEQTAPSVPKVTLAAFALLVLAYSVLITQRPLLGTFVVVGLFGIYLLWQFLELASRFVRAFERIADSLDDGEM